MARPSVSAQCDLVASYMDGVHVKIAEAYKPPRKIGLPAAYNNKFPDVSKLIYDFSLEKSVLVKMAEWRMIRQVNNKAKNLRLEEKRKKEHEEAPPPPPPSPPDNIKQLPVNVVPTSKTILMPQPLSLPANDLQDHIKTNGLDFADFDNDTSSPFDNMELQTINDMEELAQVLQPTSQWAPSTKLENILNELTVEDKSVPQQTVEKTNDTDSHTDEHAEIKKPNDVKHRSVSAIIEELQKELERPYMENWKPWPDLESPNGNACGTMKHDNSTASNHSKLMNPVSDLTEENQKLAQHLSDMGFPLSRATHAICDLGGEDNKKIVEYLLAVQSLEEIGIPGDDAEKALILTKYDQDKAKIYYENLCTLRDIGFPEDQASTALVNSDFDRDKALDLLFA